MGCDIHTYVEYASKPREGNDTYWKNFSQNGGSRNYVLFGVLAGVRYEDAQLFEPKGMPDGPLGYATGNDYWTMVAPPEHPEWADNDDYYVSMAQAEKWVDSGYSVGEYKYNGDLWRVSGPDWHSHSHLNLAELKLALDHYVNFSKERWPSEKVEVPAEWWAMVAAMEAFENAGKLTRVIFWFDN